MMSIRFCVATSLLSLCLLSGAKAESVPQADDAYPDRPVTLVTPFAPGGMSDTLARLLAEHLRKEWKQTVIVENRPGASGMIGIGHVAQSRPDGYTLLLGISQMVQAPALYATLPYDMQKDFVPLVRIADASLIFATTDPRITSLQDYVSTRRKSGETVNYGTYGLGTASHIYGEVFNGSNKIRGKPIPYKGAAPLLVDLMGGQVTVAFVDLASALPHVRSGKVRAWAVTGTVRSAALPDVPTFQELGYAGLEGTGWHGTFAPAGTPPAIVNKIVTTLQRIVHAPDVQVALVGYGLQPVSGPPDDFAPRIASDLLYWKRVITEYNIRLEE